MILCDVCKKVQATFHRARVEKDIDTNKKVTTVIHLCQICAVGMVPQVIIKEVLTRLEGVPEDKK
jgi:hypothetical protein